MISKSPTTKHPFAGLSLLDVSREPPRQPSISGNVSFDDPAVVEKLRRRDTEMFDEMVRQQAPSLARLSNRLMGFVGDHDVEDAVQEVFVRAWKKIHTFRGDARFSTWLHSIAINVCRNQLRRGKLKKMMLGKLRNRSSPVSNQPKDVTECLTIQDQIRTAISRLGPTDREVIVLRCMEERTAEDAGRLLGIPSGTVDVRLHRARGRLKAILKELDDPR